MRYCPECRSEYEDWATACSDCGSVLVAEPPPPPAPRREPLMAPGDDVVYLTNVPNTILGNLLVNQLKDVGIPAFMRRSFSADIGEFSYYDFVPHDILVPGSRVMEARRYIDSPPGSPYGGAGPFSAEWQPLTPTLDATGPEPTDGWRLPSESDYLQQRSLRKGHGAGPFGALGPRRAHAAEDDDWDDDVGSGTAPNTQRWFRVIVGLLLLAASLPWFLQIFQQMSAIFQR